MTDEVVSLRPDVELGDFFDYIYGQQVGYVYAPLKGVAQDTWETHFFEWPRQRQALITHVIENTAVAESYYGPALYRTPSGGAVLDNVMGSNVVWTEFDGNATTEGLGDKIPHPSLRLQSSLDGHEHFYWKLEEFETDREKIQNINRAIAYTLQADTSGWDATQILRPPTTKNHKRNKVVRILTQSANTYDLDYFDAIPVPKQLVKERIDLENVPEALEVISQYKWSKDDFRFFRKAVMPAGTRSSALMRLAYICAEMRMTDEEAFSILFNADTRWGKFVGRRDQQRRLLDLINRARLKYPIDPDLDVDDFQVFNWQELLDLEIHIEWMIPGILQRQGLMLISGPPGVGKTQLSMQFLTKMATGQNLFDWELGPPRKVAFFSMEMGTAELKYFQHQMDSVIEQEQRELLAKNFSFIPIGHGVLMDTEADQNKIERWLIAHKPEIVVFDSLSVTTTDELSDERTAKKIMDFANRMRVNHDVAIVFIHHNRKAQANNKKPNGLSDVYGSNFLTSQPTTVIGMWSDARSDDIELMFLKVRLAKEPATLVLNRTDGLNFVQIESKAIVRQANKVRKELTTSDAASEISEQDTTSRIPHNGFL